MFVALCACRTRFACLAFDRVFCWISADFCTEFLPANASECAARDCTFCFFVLGWRRAVFDRRFCVDSAPDSRYAGWTLTCYGGLLSG